MTSLEQKMCHEHDTPEDKGTFLFSCLIFRQRESGERDYADGTY
jgi:hypothetical protein